MEQRAQPMLLAELPCSTAAPAVPVGEVQDVQLPRLVSDLYHESPPPLRARLLEGLLRPLRPLGLAAVAAGAFGAFLHRDRWHGFQVSSEEAARYSAEQVLELARYVEQFQPEALAQLAGMVAEHPACAAGLGGALALSSLSALRLWLRAAAPGPRGARS